MNRATRTAAVALVATTLAVLAACSPQSSSRVDDAATPAAAGNPTATRAAQLDPPPPAATAKPQPEPPTELAAESFVLAEWRKAENRSSCAPISFTRTGASGEPRRANFSGGWAVAWDQPGTRSAFGIAGTGLLPDDPTDPKSQRARLAAQWPYFRDLPALPKPSFAGYGVEGAGDYPADNQSGRGVNSLAYVRVAGQACDYNVWSRLGRRHLESLLAEMRLIDTSA